MAKLTYVDTTGTHTITGVDLESGITLEEISNETEWTLVTKDDTPVTYDTDFIGGRPNDR